MGIIKESAGWTAVMLNAMGSPYNSMDRHTPAKRRVGRGIGNGYFTRGGKYMCKIRWGL